MNVRELVAQRPCEAAQRPPVAGRGLKGLLEVRRGQPVQPIRLHAQVLQEGRKGEEEGGGVGGWVQCWLCLYEREATGCLPGGGGGGEGTEGNWEAMRRGRGRARTPIQTRARAIPLTRIRTQARESILNHQLSLARPLSSLSLSHGHTRLCGHRAVFVHVVLRQGVLVDGDVADGPHEELGPAVAGLAVAADTQRLLGASLRCFRGSL
jgi:hypothetical protein